MECKFHNNTFRSDILINGSRFRWVFCQLEALRKCLSPATLRSSLVTLPRTLDETCERIMHEIDASGHLEEAILIL